MDNPPSWVRTLAADGKRFRYYIGQQSGSSFQTAFEGALAQILRKIKAEESVALTSVVEVVNRVEAAGDTVTEYDQLSERTQALVQGVVKGAEVYKAHVVRTCAGGPYFQVSLLMRRRRARIDASVPDPITTSDVVWRSAVVPGWGQLHAGHHTRGWVLLAGGVGSLTLGLLGQQFASNDFAKAASSRRQSDRAFYDERANRLQALAYVGFAIAAGTYVYNLVDATTAAPATQYYAESAPPQWQWTANGMYGRF